MTRPRTGGATGDGDAPSGTDGPGAGSGRGPGAVRPVGNVSQGQQGVQDVATLGRGGAGAQTHSPAADGDTTGDLPPGHTRDDDGNVRGPDGRYASDPYATPPAFNRDQYPSGYRQPTHDEMIVQYTDEGQALGAVPRDANGNRIPRGDLTWRDQYGQEIEDPGQNLTYEHRTPVVEHWNTDGYDQSRGERIDWYNDPENLVPMHRSENSSGGGSMTTRYRQDVGPNHSK